MAYPSKNLQVKHKVRLRPRNWNFRCRRQWPSIYSSHVNHDRLGLNHWHIFPCLCASWLQKSTNSRSCWWRKMRVRLEKFISKFSANFRWVFLLKFSKFESNLPKMALLNFYFQVIPKSLNRLWFHQFYLWLNSRMPVKFKKKNGDSMIYVFILDSFFCCSVLTFFSGYIRLISWLPTTNNMSWSAF